ncbi:MAG TPA: hypothetical protein PLL80_00815 [Candidatus Pacearchaeota archaeon]|nr:hypothetical protein [Candidatus Pacearchaeota archaeon]HOK94069.1 hypothetical protein [Candidatus Pacearchaeota archaeon]HPO75140.1 hypothetical protein [Candidatus Pacearchaeota archaeon]
MLTPFLAVSFSPGLIKAFSVEEEGNNFKILDSKEMLYDKNSIEDLKIKLTDLILEMEKRRRINFNSAIVGVKEGIGKKIITKMEFLRKYPFKPISEVEFKKMIEECQKETFFKYQKFNNSQNSFILVSAKIKEVLIDQKKAINPFGLLGKIVSISIENIYLPISFYKIINETFAKFKMQVSFEVN